MTGDIAVCRGNCISLYTLNGALLLRQGIYESADDNILSCVFYEGVSDEWLERELLFTGHRRGVVNVSPQFLAWFLPVVLMKADLEQNDPRWTVRARIDPAAAPHRSEPGYWGEYYGRDQLHSGAAAGSIYGR